MPLIMQRVYADGAWLPTLTTAGGSVTHVTRRGTFTRVGAQVWFHAQIALSAVSSPTGDVTITGLPLVSAQRGGAWLVNMAGVTLSAGYSMLSGEIAAGTSAIKLRQQGSAVAALTLPGTALSATTTIEIAGMYYASDIATLSLEDTILSLGPIAYWKLDETSGTVATDVSGNARHGTYSASGLTLGGSFAPFVAPTFDGTNGHVNIYSASLAGAINGDEGTIVALIRPASLAGTLNALRTTGGTADILRLGRAGSQGVATRQSTFGSTASLAGGAIVASSWSLLVMSYSLTTTTARLYVNGNEVAATLTDVDVGWSSTPASVAMVISGITTLSPAARWAGEIAHVAIFNTVLSAANIAAIYAASGL